MTTLAQVDADFDRIIGDAWQPTMPAKPEKWKEPDSGPRRATWPPMPVPEFPPHGGHEL